VGRDGLMAAGSQLTAGKNSFLYWICDFWLDTHLVMKSNFDRYSELRDLYSARSSVWVGSPSAARPPRPASSSSSSGRLDPSPQPESIWRLDGQTALVVPYQVLQCVYVVVHHVASLPGPGSGAASGSPADFVTEAAQILQEPLFHLLRVAFSMYCTVPPPRL
jgi:hypothetical protein